MKKFILSLSFLITTIHLFGIDGLLVKTIDYSFQEKWYNTISTTAPKIMNCEIVYEGQFFFIAPIVWDFESDENNHSEVEYSIKILNPDASVHTFEENIPVINEVINFKNNFQMSKGVLKIAFEEESELGEYKIEISILDKISNKKKLINSEITLAKLPLYTEFKIDSEKDFENWFSRYYESPSPEKALSNYIFYAKSKLSENDAIFYAIFSIFLEIVDNNQFLLPQILHCYKEQDDQTKTYLLFLLHYSKLDVPDFFNNLEGIEKEMYTSLKENSLIDKYGEIYAPSQLDMLWSTFTTNGSFQPILKLIKTLDYTKYQGELDKFKTSKQKTEEDRQKAINNAIYDSLVWSFTSNCKQHELVLKYANWALKYEDLSDIQKSELEKILGNL